MTSGDDMRIFSFIALFIALQPFALDVLNFMERARVLV